MIYFIEAVGAGLVKIGFTDRPVEDRLRELQTASPHKLRVAVTLPGDLTKEAEYHEQFSHLRQQGEWFRVDDELRIQIVAMRVVKSLVADMIPLRDGIARLENRVATLSGDVATLDDLTGRPIYHDTTEDGDEVPVYAVDAIVDSIFRIERIESALAALGTNFKACVKAGMNEECS